MEFFFADSLAFVYVSMHFRFIYDIKKCIFQCFIEDIRDKKQSIMTYDVVFAKLQAQVEKLESAAAEKDTCIAQYEAIVKGSECEVVW